MKSNYILHALFLGLYLSGANIPESLVKHIKENPYKFTDPTMSNTFSVLRGAPDLKDETLRALVVKSL